MSRPLIRSIGSLALSAAVATSATDSNTGMRIIFSLMDSDGDGTVSLQEFQAARERIFRALDTDHDGTLEEIQNFMRGVTRSAPHQ